MAQSNAPYRSGKSQFLPIAICGMACRLPGGIHSPQELWEFLIAGRDARSRVPSSRYGNSAYFSPVLKKPGAVASEYGYFLDQSVDIEAFDSSFYPIPRAELAYLDPQERILLEVARECLDDACEVDWQGQNIGVFIGSYGGDWADLCSRERQAYGPHMLKSMDNFWQSNRISHELDLRGPSMTIRTACSSSLISLNEACLAIAKGDCTSAIVGGTNIIMGHGMTVSLSELGALAPDGSCKTFSSEANGYARAEGIAAVYVKPLSSALRDGNPIRAIITGTATNSNGKSQSISRPSASAQEALIRHTYQIAGISEEDVSKTAFCEFHGTGTPVGDRLEAEAVVRVFGPLGGVHIGSTKPNLGHSEGAAGITSLIKAVLALEHRTIPPSIKFMPLNPRIPFEEGKLTLSKEASPWPEGRADRISINSFGIGGSNAHAIIESAANIGLSQAHSRETSSNTPQLLIYSAKTHNSLGEMIQRYQTIVTSDSFPLADVAYTLANRREHFPYRAFSVHAQDKICIPAVLPVWKSGQRPSLVMVFNGQGAQWPRMGKELHRCNAMFNSTIKLLENQLRSLGASWSLEEELLKPTRTSRINHAEYSQPLCTAIQIALVDTFSSIRIRPVAVVGHSSGEIAAAYAAGGLTADEAMSVAFHRGAATKLQKKAGAMAAIGTGWEEVERHLVPGVVLACDNSHKGVTISGDAEKLEDVIANIKRSYPDILTSKLKVSHAYHSHHMAEIGEEYFQSMVTSKVVGEKPRIPFFSTVKGELLTTDRLGPKYWQDNLEQPVRFKSAVYDLLDSSGFNHPVFLEIGPHPSLAGSLRQNLTHASRNTLALVSTFSKQQDSSETFLAAVGKLYTFHLGVDFKALMPAESHACAPGLPPYPWDRQRIHRTESRVSKELRYNSVPYHNLLGRRVHESTDFEPIWRNLLHLENVPWVRDHMIDNDIVFPFSGYISMAAEAMQQTSNTRLNNVQFRETAVEAALLLSESEPTELVTTFRRQRPTERIESEWWNFSISSHNGTVWTKHCSGAVRTYRENTSKKPGRMESLPRIVSIQKWYKALDRRGLNYGFHFKVLEHATSSTIAPRMAKSRVRNNWHGDEEDYYLHPVIVDSMFQTLSVAAQHGLTHAYRKLIATSIESLTISRCSSDHFTVSTSAELLRDGVLGAGSCTSGSQIVMEVSGARLTILDNNEHRSISTMPILARSEFVSHIDFVDVKSLAEGLQDWDKYGGLLDELASLSMSRYRQVATGIVDDKIPHLQMYKAWLNQQPPSNINTATPNSSIISLVNQLADTPAAYLAAAILKMCESAQEILLGEKTTSDILSEVDNLNKVKSFGVTSWSSNMCSKFIQALALSTPCLRVLELGAGYGTSTGGYLDTLTHPNGQHLYSQYVCADTSMGMLNVIKEKFMTAKNLETTLLDVNKNLSTQSLDDDDKKFDLIIASSILHKTSRLHESFVNLHKLLSANGRLLIKEPCSSFYWRKYVLGVLPEWMNDGQNGKGKEELCLSPRQWTETLVAAGFETPEIVVQGDSDVVVITRRAKDEEITDLKKVRLLCSEHSAPDTLLTKELEARGYEITRCTLSTLPPDGQDIISVLDLDEKSFFEDIEEPVFENFKDFIMNVQSSGASIFWVTRLCQISPANPKFAPIIGLSRTLRVEKSLDFAVCETDDFHSTSGCATIVDVFDAFQRRESEKDGPGVDFEFAISKNNILVPRIFPFSQEDELQSNRKFDQGYLEVKNLGTLDKMHWIGQQSSAAPRAAEVEADVYAIGIDFKDVQKAMEMSDDPKFHLVSEGAGIVRRVGPDVAKVRVGDRVLFVGTGAISTITKAAEQLFEVLPESISFVEGAGIPLDFMTAIYSIIHIGRLEKEQSILIHSGGQGIGIAAIQVSKFLGAEIYATVQNEEESKYLAERYSIPRDHIFDSRNVSFDKELMLVTSWKGVDLALNCLSGELPVPHAVWRCVTEGGILVETGKNGFQHGGKSDLDVLFQNRSYSCVNMDQIIKRNPQLCNRLLHQIMEYIRDGHLNLIRPPKLIGGKENYKASEYTQQRERVGKTVLRLRDEVTHHLEQVMSSPRMPVKSFDESGSYLLVGGLGGIGRSISLWMVQNGARNLTFLTRGGGNRPQDQGFVDELKSMGCTVKLERGDVTDADNVLMAVDASNELAPLKGVMQLSMVLRDKAFERMSLEDWTYVMKPKVNGTWNLHNATLEKGCDLDFLLLFSSISGTIGQAGQANYSSANTFLDAFVEYRTGMGLPCSAIALGAMEDVGYLSEIENEGLLKKMQQTGWRGNSEAELLEALNLAVAGGRHSPKDDRRRVTTPNQFSLGIQEAQTRLSTDARLSIYRNEKGGSNNTISSTDVLQSFLATAKKDPSTLQATDAATIMAREIGKAILGLLSGSAEAMNIELDTKTSDLGLDSIIVGELHAWWKRNFGFEISVLELLSTGTLGALGMKAIHGLEKTI